MSDIEFSFEVKERALDVGLHDEGSITAVTVSFSFFQDGLNLIKSQAHLNAISTVTVFSRLDNPGIVFLKLAFLLTGFGYFLCSFMIIPQKFKILLIFKSIFDVESKGQIIKNVLFNLLIIIAHSIKESLFVTQDIVVDEVVM